MSVAIPAIYQTAQIREIELLARRRYAIAGHELMQRAGRGACRYLLRRWPEAQRIVVICGTGNNGGDGYVLAQAAHERGLKVIVMYLGAPDRLSAGARHAYDLCHKAGVTLLPFTERYAWQQVDVIVDALCGIGLQSEVRRDIAHVMQFINQRQPKQPVLALDVPSGIHADTGAMLGEAIHAQATITFIGMKVGLLTGHGVAGAGEIYCDDLQLPPEIFSLSVGHLTEIQLTQFAPYLQPRPRDMHKGVAGHVLIIGGAPGYTGAPRMAAAAAMRVGAGLVTVATQPRLASVMNLTLPEIMCVGITHARQLQPLLNQASVIVLGPGLGQSSWAKALLKKVLATPLPLVVDADGLNLLAQYPRPVTRADWILTPHPGEAGRLLQVATQQVQADRVRAATEIAERFQAITVLKGAGTLVVSPNASATLCTAGNPGMASAGMGDVLSGVIGGLLAQGVPTAAAASLGVCLHAHAADQAAAAEGERGMMATDLLPYLRLLVNNR